MKRIERFLYHVLQRQGNIFFKTTSQSTAGSSVCINNAGHIWVHLHDCSASSRSTPWAPLLQGTGGWLSSSPQCSHQVRQPCLKVWAVRREKQREITRISELRLKENRRKQLSYLSWDERSGQAGRLNFLLWFSLRPLRSWTKGRLLSLFLL